MLRIGDFQELDIGVIQCPFGRLMMVKKLFVLVVFKKYKSYQEQQVLQTYTERALTILLFHLNKVRVY